MRAVLLLIVLMGSSVAPASVSAAEVTVAFSQQKPPYVIEQTLSGVEIDPSA